MKKYLTPTVNLVAPPLTLIALLTWVTMTRPYENGPVIRSDGVGYHVWVYGLLRRDLSFCAYRPVLDGTKAIAVIDERRSVCGLKYPPGVALLQLPVVGPWVDLNETGGFPREVHGVVLCLGAFLLMLTAIFSYLTLRRLGVEPIVGQSIIAVFLFGTGLFHYATYDASFSHIYSAAGIALMLLVATVARESGWNRRLLALFALTAFWLYTVRQTNGLLTLLISGTAVTQANRKTAVRIAMAWTCATAAALVIQVAYNAYVTGHLTVNSYGHESFVRWGGRFADVWFSYERGLGTYYPIIVLALVLSPLCPHRPLMLAFVVAVNCYAFLYSSWHSWTLGDGMGPRGFVEVAPLGIVVLGSAMNRLQPRGRTLVILLSSVCVYVTLQITTGYWRGSFPWSGADARLYWRHLLHPTGSQVLVSAVALAVAVAWRILVAGSRFSLRRVALGSNESQS